MKNCVSVILLLQGCMCGAIASKAPIQNARVVNYHNGTGAANGKAIL
jgi:hypothetical protein